LIKLSPDKIDIGIADNLTAAIEMIGNNSNRWTVLNLITLTRSVLYLDNISHTKYMFFVGKIIKTDIPFLRML
jgi:hypothetical protein